MTVLTINFDGVDYIVINLIESSIYNFISTVSRGRYKYLVADNLAYYSRRYNKWVLIECGDKSDGATNAPDIDSFSWLVHDELCKAGLFSDGSKCNNWQASMILSDILSSEGRWFRAKTWFIATWLLGGGEARKNGMF